MFNKLKVAQAEKQIYPQSVGQTNKVEEGGRGPQPAMAVRSGLALFMIPRFGRIGSGIQGKPQGVRPCAGGLFRAAVKPFGVAAFAEFSSLVNVPGQSCGSFLSGGL